MYLKLIYTIQRLMKDNNIFVKCKQQHRITDSSQFGLSHTCLLAFFNCHYINWMSIDLTATKMDYFMWRITKETEDNLTEALSQNRRLTKSQWSYKFEFSNLYLIYLNLYFFFNFRAKMVNLFGVWSSCDACISMSLHRQCWIKRCIFQMKKPQKVGRFPSLKTFHHLSLFT